MYYSCKTQCSAAKTENSVLHMQTPCYVAEPNKKLQCNVVLCSEHNVLQVYEYVSYLRTFLIMPNCVRMMYL